MSEYELHDLISGVIGFHNSVFEYWLALSFAAVVAATYANNQLRKRYLKLLSIGYFLTTVYLMMTRMVGYSRLQEYMSKLEKGGYESPEFATSGLGIFAGIADISIFIGGTIAVLFYILWASKA